MHSDSQTLITNTQIKYTNPQTVKVADIDVQAEASQNLQNYILT